MNKLPIVEIRSSHGARTISAKWIFLHKIPKHEYMLTFTFARLVKFAIERYNESSKSLIQFYESNETLYLSGYIDFINNLESAVDNLHRSSRILKNILEDYPKYLSALPDHINEVQAEIFSSTIEIRNKIQHIDGKLLAMKSSEKSSRSLAVPSLNKNNEFQLFNEKIPIGNIVNWLTKYNEYANIIAEFQ